jgi:hypothetical protein
MPGDQYEVEYSTRLVRRCVSVTTLYLTCATTFLSQPAMCVNCNYSSKQFVKQFPGEHLFANSVRFDSVLAYPT